MKFNNMLNCREGYIKNNILYPIYNKDDKPANMVSCFYIPIVLTQYNKYYMILKQKITYDILENFELIINNSNLGWDILNKISEYVFGDYRSNTTQYNGFVHHNFDFLKYPTRTQKLIALYKYFIINNLCEFASVDQIFNLPTYMLQNSDIRNYLITNYRDKEQQYYNGHYWIILDYLEHAYNQDKKKRIK